jgi:hypothetical protein
MQKVNSIFFVKKTFSFFEIVLNRDWANSKNNNSSFLYEFADYPRLLLCHILPIELLPTHRFFHHFALKVLEITKELPIFS